MEFVQNNLLLIAVAFVSGAMLVWPLVRRGAGGPWVNTLEATQLINRKDAIVLDVRSAEEFARGHPMGAKNVPLAELAKRAGELAKNKNRPVIVACESGNRSTSAISVLREAGFAEVYNLAGGYGAWQQAGLPVEK